jgi:hypothetical protein
MNFNSFRFELTTIKRSMEQIMIAAVACFLFSALLGLRLVSLIAFIPVMLLAAVAALAVQGVLSGLVVLVIMQAGYFSGVALRALRPGRSARPALRRIALR